MKTFFAYLFQVECFVEALRQNLIAVLPTGAGKTLIASMWLKRMKELNPEKMGLFVVDKIPLVKQQAKVTFASYISNTRGLGALRAPTCSLRPFGPA